MEIINEYYSCYNPQLQQKIYEIQHDIPITNNYHLKLIIKQKYLYTYLIVLLHKIFLKDLLQTSPPRTRFKLRN